MEEQQRGTNGTETGLIGATRRGKETVPVVVGIGASAGGLKALKDFFQGFAADSGLAFVVVMHLAPDRESRLVEVLRAHVGLPVVQITDDAAIEPDRVYVIPPGRNVSTIDTHLRLSEMGKSRFRRAPIDYFLRTLAASHDGRSIAVILSGSGSDGALGVREIKGQGGVVFVQDPKEAEFDGMPQSAMATGVADFVLPAGQMASAMMKFVAVRPRVPPALPDRDGESRGRLLQDLLALLRDRTGRDFTRYKTSTVLRRIARRMQLCYVQEFAQYVEYLREHSGELEALADDLLINVTSFFRDPETSEKLAAETLPKLFADKGSDQQIRLWVVGCATGEEAYSMAMLLLEECEKRSSPPKCLIFASDLHKASLERAREGFYYGDIEVDVSEARLARFFQRERGGFRVKSEVRDLIVFAPHNLLYDPPFSRLDWVSCRNVLIYFQRDLQRDVIRIFHYALNPDGYLLLGSSENVDDAGLFRVEDKALHLYRKRNVPSPEPGFEVFPLQRPNSSMRFKAGSPEHEPLSYEALHHRMVMRASPASLLIDGNNRVVQLSAGVGRFLTHPSGTVTSSIFKLIREELLVDLRLALVEARGSHKPVDSRPVHIALDNGPVLVILHVRPSQEPDSEGMALIAFEARIQPKTEDSADPPVSTPARQRAKKIRELESELHSTRHRLQSLIDEHETNQEEMRAANEEMQSTNEELRSTLEELETSKEELQSINEELHTVNQENRQKVEELAQLSADLNNLLGATDIATIFLDQQLRILRFTPQLSALFNVLATDRGRPLSDLRHGLRNIDLSHEAQQVLKNLQSLEREVEDDKDRSYLLRMSPYRSEDDRIEGIVISFVDISERISAEKKLRQSEERYRLLIDSAREYAIMMVGTDGEVLTWNSGAERLFGYTESEMVGQPAARFFSDEDRAKRVLETEMKDAAQYGHASSEGWRIRKDGSRFWGSGAMEPVFVDGALRGFSKVLRDNSERRQSEQALNELNSSLEQRVEKATSKLREMTALVTMAEHRERNRISEMLHDGLQQLLYSVQVKLMLRRNVAGPDELATLDEAQRGLEKAIKTARELSVDLSPQVLDTEGLPEALEWLAGQMDSLYGLDVDIDASGTFEIDTPMRVLLFQAVRELLFNIVKHAGTNRAWINMFQHAGDLLIRVRDKGCGFDVDALGDQPSLGGLSVEHRLYLIGGDVEVNSELGQGTTVTIRFPLELDQGNRGARMGVS